MTASVVLDNGDKYCTIHNLKMVSGQVRVPSWKKCGDGLHRNVYKIVKTWRCNYKPTILRNLTKPAVGEIKTGQTVQRYSIFTTSRKRRKQ